MPLPTQNCPFPWGIWTPSNTIPWAHSSHNTNSISTGSAIFAQMTAECRYTLQWDAPSPPQNCPFALGIWTPSNMWFPGHTLVLNPNSILIGSAISAGLTSVTDRPTDKPCYSVGNNRLHLRTQYGRNRLIIIMMITSCQSNSI